MIRSHLVLVDFFYFFFLRCFIDCGAIVSASNKLRVTSECLNSPCNGSVYEWRLSMLNGSDSWENIPILPNMTSTAVNSTNMIIKKNSLQSKSKYNLTLFVTSSKEAYGFSVLLFETAGEPHDGYCAPSVSEGVSLKTEFTFKCFNWQDTILPLTYEFALGEEPISYGTSPSSVSTVLPAGSPNEEFQQQVTIVIKNAVGVSVVEKLFIKVLQWFIYLEILFTRLIIFEFSNLICKRCLETVFCVLANLSFFLKHNFQYYPIPSHHR